MSSSMRSILLNPRPLRSLASSSPSSPSSARAARRCYAAIPTKKPTASRPLDPSSEQAMPIGAFYEAILNTPQPIPDVKPEEPATSAKEHQAAEAAEAAAQEEAAPAVKEPVRRGRKSKATLSKTEPAATATAATTPAASPAATAKATAKEAAAAQKSSSVRSPSSSSPPPPGPTANAQEKAKVIFGSSLAGPAERAERLARIRARSEVVAGVTVPPKPEEPDNCCMSGCVNCVWDRFRDEMEEWAVARAEADSRLAAGWVQETSASASVPARPTLEGPAGTAVTMDDDGGGSETNWNIEEAAKSRQSSPGKITKDLWEEDLYKNIPVGIREFMKQEKRLKEKHMREGTTGG